MSAPSDDAGVFELVMALSAMREEWGCASTGASYVSPDGVVVTLTVYREFFTLADDRGNIQSAAKVPR
jgi:hypothetical protein